MVSRRPLVLASGLLSELPPGDTVVGADVTVGTLTAGSGLSGGGNLSSNQRVDVSLVANPSGIIFVGNQLGLDGVAQRTADTALSSGNAALARTLIQTAVNLSGGVTGAVPYQSGVDTTAFLNPGVSGQVLATQGANLAPTWITPGGGKVLQVVQAVSSGVFSTSSTTYASGNLSVAITPSSTSNKVLVCVSLAGVSTANGVSNGSSYYTIYRGTSTNLASAGGFAIDTNISTSINSNTTVSMLYLDSPSTTSSTSYITYVKALSGGVAYYNIDHAANARMTSTIIAMEIAG